MILIACHDPKLVNRWSRALGKKYPLYAVGQKTALLRAVTSLKPRLLILHVGLPRLRAVRELPAIQKLSPLTKIVVVSELPTTAEGVSLVKAGAKGYCNSSISSALLNKAAKAVLQNELWAGRQIISALVEQMISPTTHETRAPRPTTPFDCLTERKRQIADLVIHGAHNKAIASRLNISEATVKAHLTDIFRQLHLSGRLELALLSKAQTLPK
jgi:DNA-binding NarL/FixJ family response regulator